MMGPESPPSRWYEAPAYECEGCGRYGDTCECGGIKVPEEMSRSREEALEIWQQVVRDARDEWE